MSQDKIKVIVKRPDEMIGHTAWISNTLRNLQKTVGGYVEAVTIRPIVILCNEEGLINRLPFNCELGGYQLFGTIIVCGIDGEDFGDIPMTFDEWKQFFYKGGYV